MELLARWQPLEEFIARVVNVLYDDFPASGGALPGVDVLLGGQRCPGGVFSTANHSVESFPGHGGAVTTRGWCFQ